VFRFRQTLLLLNALRFGVDPRSVNTREFGRVVLRFSGHSAGSLRLITDSFQRETAIERFPF
jgi:hypothetical protein